MPRRAEHLPTHLERTLLQKLRTGLELPLRKLDETGGRSQTIQKLLAKGWIEFGSSNGSYRITPQGDAALRTPMPIIREQGPRLVETGLKAK